ncbi:sugar-binding protein [Sediminibacillus halophilus]|uniref:Ribose transport system substrate-binding protein n=1 Tax=Sediminibacillus halophilus TaxID=482461 RepID=A0A1G9RFS8_9BACI|nr:sugar-binding protein [Sediminibacillus halophilus]SDM22179.1 ribose transport system substrate-binding protein [Sediminibacillus halophilus]
MKKLPKSILFTIVLAIFLTSFLLMLYYGKETFYVEKQISSQQLYDYHFALITEEVGNDYWRQIENGAKEEAAKHNVYLEYIGPRKSDNEEKLQTFDRMISSKVDGIITQGMPGERFKALVHKAVERGIEVITVDTDVPQSERQLYVGTDNYKAGFSAGQAVIKDTEGEIKVGAVVGMYDALNQQERLQGFKEAIAETDRIELVDVLESNITEIGAAEATYSLLKQHPQINALIGMSALDGLGIVQGIEEIHLGQTPYVLSFDILPQTLEMIDQGKIAATVTQYPTEMGKQAVSRMVDLQHGRKVEPLQYTGTEIIRAKDINNGEIIRKGEGS